MVTCNKCLQYLHIDSTWCVIQYNKRFYECKDLVSCIELRRPYQHQQPKQPKQPKPSAPPIDLKLDIQPPCYHSTSKSIIKRFSDFFFPRYNEYSKVKYS
jgi:hypothetical protein